MLAIPMMLALVMESIDADMDQSALLLDGADSPRVGTRAAVRTRLGRRVLVGDGVGGVARGGLDRCVPSRQVEAQGGSSG